MGKNHGNWYVPSTGILPGGEEPDINFTGYPRGYSANRIADIKTLKVDYFFKGTRCILKQISSGPELVCILNKIVSPFTASNCIVV